MAIIISEVNPSGSTRSYAADWFEVTNTGTTDVDITGWSIDDNSHLLANAVPLRGVKIIPAGKSVVFIDGGAAVAAVDTSAAAIAAATTATATADAVVLGKFETAWFGDTTTKVPAGFLFGFYGGAGVGLSGTADEVNLFDKNGAFVAGVSFGAAAVGVAPAAGQTFDNASGISFAALPTAVTTPNVSVLSVVGTNGAFQSADGADIGSPGKIAAAVVTPPAANPVNLSVSSNAGSETAKSVITVTATAASAVTAAQTVALGVTGTGITSGDYTLSSPTITILSGATSGTATFTVVDDTLVEGTETATLTISNPSAGITLGATTAQNIVIADNDVAAPPTSNNPFDLSKYVQVGRYDLPEPSHPNTVVPTNSLLAQEVSAVTYDWDTDTLFVVGDGGTSIVQVDKKGNLIDSMTLALDPAKPQGTYFFDPEGLTYVGGGKFVLMEERYRQANLFTYKPNTTLTGAGAQTVKLGSTIGNIGNEGITYDPLSTPTTGGIGFVVVKEKQPEGLFQTTIDFAKGTATNGSPTTEPTDLFDPTKLNLLDIADVYALSTLSNSIGKDYYDHLLVLSQESGQIVETDRAGKIYSTLTIDPEAKDANGKSLTTPLSVASPLPAINVVDQQHEGITVDKDGFLYVTSENGGGDISRPQLWVYAPSKAVVNPNPAVNLSVSSNAGSEAAKSVITVTATAAAAVTSNQTVNLAVTGTGITTGDYTLASPTITIPTGATSGSTTFTVVDDTAVEGTETATLTISSPSAGISLGNTIAQNIVITDNDVAPGAPTVNLSVSSNAGSEAAKTAITVTATASSPVTSNQTVNLAVTGTGIGTDDYTLSSNTITILSGATTGTATFTVVDDPVVEATETATLTISAPSAGIALGTTTTQNIVITDNDVAPPTVAPSIVITEASPWSSGNSAYKADWFELTNTGTTAVDITGWKIDDNSNSFGSAVALRGVTSIAPGKSVVFIEGLADGSTDKTIDESFSNTWFGTATPPAGVAIGNYGGAGVGLSTGGDAVNIFDASGKLITGITFPDSTASFFFTFDNAAGLGSSTFPTPSVATLSKVGTNGGFVSFNGLETGSPGSIVTTPTLSIAATTANATETDSTPGVFRITSDVKATTALTVNYTVSGTATNGVDYTRLLGTATIAAGQSSVDVLVTPVDDVLSEGNEAVTLTLATATGYAIDAVKSAATVTVIDNEPTPVGTAGNDNLVATPGTKFDGQSNIIFTGDGNDIVDLAAYSLAGGNRVETGNGNDTIYVSTNDVIFGGAGNDIFDATGGLGGNRMSGDAGNDIFYLGKNDRAIGGAGNDQFYVQSYGGNLLSGGAGRDQFFLVNGELPDAPNTVLDFQIGTDIIGFNGAASLGISASTIKFTQVGADTNIVFGTQILATLSGIQASQLNAANQTQFTFA